MSKTLKDHINTQSFSLAKERPFYKAKTLDRIIIKYLDVGPQAQLPPPYAEDISALLTLVLS